MDEKVELTLAAILVTIAHLHSVVDCYIAHANANFGWQKTDVKNVLAGKTEQLIPQMVF